jgi:four helix bundle protein
MNTVKHFRELDVYQGAMSLVIRIFELTKHFPIEERYTLTDQVRRSSRSVCANLAEAWGDVSAGRRVGVSASEEETNQRLVKGSDTKAGEGIVRSKIML